MLFFSESMFNQLIVDVVKVKELWWYVSVNFVISTETKNNESDSFNLICISMNTSYWPRVLKGENFLAKPFVLISGFVQSKFRAKNDRKQLETQIKVVDKNVQIK